VTCVGLVAIMMVLPTSIWKGGSARASVRVETKADSKKNR
jgi:hypothetical protein